MVAVCTICVVMTALCRPGMYSCLLFKFFFISVLMNSIPQSIQQGLYHIDLQKSNNIPSLIILAVCRIIKKF